MKYKLGKAAPKFHPKTLKFGEFLLPNAPLPEPSKTYWEYKIPPDTIGMYGNDELSDCLAAYVAHHVMLLTAHTGKIFIPDLADVIKFYSKFSGYTPGNPATDNGGTFVDVYNLWQTEGFCGHKILAWSQIDMKNRDHRKQANYAFGGLGVGVQLPSSAQDQFSAKQTWTWVPNDTTEGGHAILESGDGALGHNFESWGRGDVKATNEWDANYTDEVYCVITKDWINNATGLAPNMFNMDALVAALNVVRA